MRAITKMEQLWQSLPALCDEARDRALEFEEGRAISPDFADKLKAANIFNVMIPEAAGGLGGSLPDWIEVMIKLARHDFALAREPDWSLKAETGERFDLHAGTNCVGRSRVNEFAVNSSLKQVSRKHLIAEPLGADMIALTDVSTGGTFIPPEALAS